MRGDYWRGKKMSEETKSKMSKSHEGLNTWSKGRKHTTETLEKMRVAHSGSKNHNFGKKFSQETKDKISNSRKGLTAKENHPMWIKDRTKLKTASGNEERRSSRYKDWRRQVCDRDSWKCKISNSDCSGRLEIHHILSFTKFPELKYDINNGIALCHFHHPRRRVDEINLSPYFQSLVMNVK